MFRLVVMTKESEEPGQKIANFQHRGLVVRISILLPNYSKIGNFSKP